MSVSAFPWRRLPRVSRQEADDLLALRRLLSYPAVARVQAALSALLEAPVSITPRSVGRLDALTPPTRDGGLVRFALEEAGWVAFEPEMALVARLAAAVTKRPAPVVLRAGESAPAALGAFAAIIAAALRKAGHPTTLSVLTGFGPSSVSEDLLVAELSILVFDERTRARVFFPEALLRGGYASDGVDASALGEVALRLPIVGGRFVATASEVGTINPGDVWVIGKDLALVGKAWLANPEQEQGLCVEIEQTGRVVLRDGLEELSWSPMNDASDEPETTKHVLTAVGDIPVVVRVEIGNATMTAREWSQLVPGDVVGVGARVGDMVTLRVSGHAVAEGDLVDLDGEVAVRIRRRIAP